MATDPEVVAQVQAETSFSANSGGFDEHYWKQLLNLIRTGKVVSVIGPELLRLPIVIIRVPE